MTEKVEITIKWLNAPQLKSQSLKALVDDTLPFLRKRIRLMLTTDIFLSKVDAEISYEDEQEYKISEIIQYDTNGRDRIIFLQRRTEEKKNFWKKWFQQTESNSTNETRLTLKPNTMKNEERPKSPEQEEEKSRPSVPVEPEQLTTRVLLNNACLYGFNLENGALQMSGTKFFEEPQFNSIPADAHSFPDQTEHFETLSASKITSEFYTYASTNKALASLKIPCTGSLRGIHNKGNTQEILSENETKYCCKIHMIRKRKIFLLETGLKICDKVKTFFKERDVTMGTVDEFYKIHGHYVPITVTVGGIMVSYEEESGRNNAQAEDKNDRVGAQAKAGNGVLQAGVCYNQTHNQEKKEFEQDWKKERGFIVKGGVRTQNLKVWEESLENPNTWQIIEYEKFALTTDFLDKDIKAKIVELEEKQVNEKQNKETTSSELQDIQLKKIMAICSTNGVLVIFFQRAIQFLSGPEFKVGTGINVSVPWENVYSANCLKSDSANCLKSDSLYALTDKGLYSIDVKTRKYKEICAIENVSLPAAVIQHAGEYYLFTGKVILKVNEETGETSQYKTLPGSYANAITYDKGCVYLLIQTRYFLVSSQYGVYQINLAQNSEPQLLTNDKTWAASLLVSDSKLYIFAEQVFVIPLNDNEKKKEFQKNFSNSVGAVQHDSTQIILAVGERSDVSWRSWWPSKDTVSKGLHNLYRIPKGQFKQITTNWDKNA